MSNNHIEVKPVAGFIGAEISNVDLSRPLHDDAVKEIRQALLKWKVLFFRGQNIDHAAQIAFTAMFLSASMVSAHKWLKVNRLAIDISRN